MKMLTALDGTLIVAGHITTVKYGLDREAYDKACTDRFMARHRLKRAEQEGDTELAATLTEKMVEMFPEGAPRIKDYYQTRVGLSDGTSHFVNMSRDAVVALLFTT